MTNEIDYTAFGFTFVAGAVSHGKVELRTAAQIPTITDLTLCIDHFGNDVVTGWINGSSSLTVDAQRIARANQNVDAETMRALVYNSMRGVRSARARTVTTVTVRMLPNGSTFTGTTIEELRAATFAALHDMGVPNDVARATVDKITF